MEPLGPADPRRLGSYQLLAKIGSGAMGKVFLGRSLGGRAVAIKLVHAWLANDPEFRARFHREVTAARAVTGAFTAPVIDADPDAATPWLATAFLPGMSLAEVVGAHGPLPAPAVYALAVSLTEALGSIHRAGVVHRDLKPSNILLTPEGPRVIDFGIARAAETGTITQTGFAVGSPGYMAPEQAAGGDTGPAADVFALGAIITYAATGVPPFGGGSAPELIFRIVHQPPYLDAITDPGLRALAADCLVKDPRQRPTAARLLELFTPAQVVRHGTGWLPPAVASAIMNRATAPLPQPVTARRSIGRRALLIGGVSGAAVLAAGGGAAALVAAGRRRSPVLWTFDMPDYLAKGPKVAGGAVLAMGNDETIALDPGSGAVRWRSDIRLARAALPVALDGRCFLYDNFSLNALDAATGRLLWSRSLETFAPQPVPAVLDGVVCMTASPGTGDYVLSAFDAASGERRWQYDIERMAQANAAAAGRMFLVGSGEEMLYAIDAATGGLRWQQPTRDQIVSTPVVAGGLALVSTEGFDVLAFDAATGRPRWRAAIGGTNRLGAMPAVAGGTVFVGGANTLHALNASDGREMWAFAVDEDAQAPPPDHLIPAVAGGIAVFHDGRGTLHAAEVGSGKARWSHKIEGGLGERPVIMNGTVYFAGSGGVLGFDPATGSVRYRLDRSAVPSDQTFRASSLAMADGILLCAMGSKSVYALRPEPA